MSATVTRDLATGAAIGTTRRRHSIPIAIRLGIGLDRSMWPADRAIAEFRWAALTLGLMFVLALAAHLLADPTGRYGRAVVVTGIAVAVVGLLAWSPFSPRLTATRVVRRGIGPTVLLVAIAAAGLSAPADLGAQQQPHAGVGVRPGRQQRERVGTDLEERREPDPVVRRAGLLADHDDV